MKHKNNRVWLLFLLALPCVVIADQRATVVNTVVSKRESSEEWQAVHVWRGNGVSVLNHLLDNWGAIADAIERYSDQNPQSKCAPTKKLPLDMESTAAAKEWTGNVERVLGKKGAQEMAPNNRVFVIEILPGCRSQALSGPTGVYFDPKSDMGWVIVESIEGFSVRSRLEVTD